MSAMYDQGLLKHSWYQGAVEDHQRWVEYGYKQDFLDFVLREEILPDYLVSLILLKHWHKTGEKEASIMLSVSENATRKSLKKSGQVLNRIIPGSDLLSKGEMFLIYPKDGKFLIRFEFEFKKLVDFDTLVSFMIAAEKSGNYVVTIDDDY